MVIFYNISNHPSDKWSDEQKAAALKMADNIADVPFPNIDPHMTREMIKSVALNMIYSMDCDACIRVHVMGESGFTYRLVLEFKKRGIMCFHSTTERVVSESTDGETGEFKKISTFKFVQFREY